MPQEKDKIVSNVYETYDYSKFSVLAENRGRKDSKGIKAKKIKTLQRKVDKGEWIPSMSRVRVNEKFQVIDGAHTLEICRVNGMPIRYEITQDDKFNEVSRRDLIGNVYSINANTTSWTSNEFFEAAVQVKAPLAVRIKEILEANDNYFNWLDLLALIMKDPKLFFGRWRERITMKIFEDKDLLLKIDSEEFDLEVKAFAKINAKARVCHKRQAFTKNVYEILWYAHDMIKPMLFRKACASIPDSLLESSDKTRSDDSCRRMILQHYNKSQGQTAQLSTILYTLKKKDIDEPVLSL